MPWIIYLLSKSVFETVESSWLKVKTDGITEIKFPSVCICDYYKQFYQIFLELKICIYLMVVCALVLQTSLPHPFIKTEIKRVFSSKSIIMDSLLNRTA